MKKPVTLLTAAFILSILLHCCQTSPQSLEENSDAELIADAIAEEVVAEEPVTTIEDLPADVQARNIYTNTTVILSGSILFAFGDVLGSKAQDLKEAFSKLAKGEGTTADVDSKINKLPANIMFSLDKMKRTIDSTFITLKETHPVVYDKMFNHTMMSEGIAIANKEKLSAGFKPLTQNLNAGDVKRYILRMVVEGNANASKDPMILNYKEIIEWMQKVNIAFAQDTEIAVFMETLKRKK